MSALASPSPVKKKVPEEGQVAPKPEKEVEKPAFASTADRQAKATAGKEGGKRIAKTEEVKEAKKPVEKKKEIKVEEKKGKVIEKKIKRPFSVPNLYWRLAIAGVLSLILTGGIFFSSAKLKAQVSEVEKKRGQMVALQEKEESLRLLSLTLNSLKEEIPIVEKALPNERGVVDFIKEVGILGEKVMIESLSFGTDQPQLDQAGNSYIEWTIQASGSLTDLEEFLEKILSLPILIRPKVIDVDNVNEETSKLVFRAWLYVNPNFFPEEE